MDSDKQAYRSNHPSVPISASGHKETLSKLASDVRF